MVPEAASILLVDDVPENLHVLGGMLARAGYTPRPATRAEAALRLIARAPVDLAVLDIHMPGTGGFELCDALKADVRFRHVPVIFLSGDQDTAQKVEAFRRGGVDYITKPFQFEEVCARVETQLRLQRDERRARALQAEVLRQERLATVGRLVMGVAHELSTPLGVAITAGTFLAGALGDLQGALTAPQPSRAAVLGHLQGSRDSVALLSANLARAAALLQQFRLMAEEPGGAPSREYELGALVGDAVSGCNSRESYPHVAVRVECPEPVRATVAAGPLAQVVTHLTRNALARAEAAVVLTVERAGERVVLSCRDDGPILDGRGVAQAFEPLEGVGARGLALFLAHALVHEALGGDITVRSAPGEGTTLCVTFPIRV